ncbi:hypothetical protein FRC17_007494 [Serendipita sp. 399]|nr:hypothetical protein FRC17_007494 [Serendipita sp. 399]
MSSNIPLHEPVGSDPNNWTTLTNSEANVRAKAVEKGHTPHDWRYAVKKVFHTDKAYPEEVRETLNATENTTNDRDTSAAATGSNTFTGSNDYNSGDMANEQRSTGFDRFDQQQSHQRDAPFAGEYGQNTNASNQYDQHRTDAPLAGERHHHHTAMQDQSNMGRQEYLTAPENAPEMLEPFGVKVGREDMIDDLKRTIFEGHKVFFKSLKVDASELAIYKADISATDIAEGKRHALDALQSALAAEPLTTTDDVHDHLPTPLEKKVVYFIARSPYSGGDPARKRQRTSSPHPPANGPDMNEANEVIARCLTEAVTHLKSRINLFLEEDGKVPLFGHPRAAHDISKWIEDLAIPSATKGATTPSLLLHELGRHIHDTQMAERVNKLFGSTTQLTYLYNTSGSGKTRLLLEGLWENWGLYFTVGHLPEKIGSKDLGRVLKVLKEDELVSLQSYKGVDLEIPLSRNRKVCKRRFTSVLLTRVLALRVFLDCVVQKNGGKIPSRARQQWLLLQLIPSTLVEVDIFDLTARSMARIPCPDLDQCLAENLAGITQYVGPIFCVLDEAQELSKIGFEWLRSEDMSEPRAILGEVILSWIEGFDHIIISGTGKPVVDKAIRSIVSKVVEPSSDNTFTDLGAFDNATDQRRYLSMYFPPKGEPSGSWDLVVSRASQ